MIRSHASRAGYTLVELVLVMCIMALIALMGIRQYQLLMDRLATRDAVRAASTVVARAREEAVAMHTPVSVRIDTVASSLEPRRKGTRTRSCRPTRSGWCARSNA